MSAAELTAWLTPAPPGVTDTTFASEFPPATLMIVWNVTGIPYAARKTPITPSLQIHAPRASRTVLIDMVLPPELGANQSGRPSGVEQPTPVPSAPQPGTILFRAAVTAR